MTLLGTCIGYGLWIFAGGFWVLVLSRAISGIASGNLSVATASIADVTTRESRSKGMAFVGVAFGLGFIFGPALGGWASQFVLISQSESDFGLNPFSIAATISFLLALVNICWLFYSFKETLHQNKRVEKKIQNPSYFSLEK